MPICVYVDTLIYLEYNRFGEKEETKLQTLAFRAEETKVG